MPLGTRGKKAPRKGVLGQKAKEIKKAGRKKKSGRRRTPEPPAAPEVPSRPSPGAQRAGGCEGRSAPGRAQTGSDPLRNPPTPREPPLSLPTRLCAALATGNMMRAQRVPLTTVKNKMVAAEVAVRRGPVGNAGLLLAAAELRGRARPGRRFPGCSPAPPGYRRALCEGPRDTEKRIRP